MNHNQAYNSIKRKRKKERKHPMTQIIAALCNNKKDLILIGDRQVTTTDDTLHYDYEPKLKPITEKAICLEAGTMHEPEVIADSKTEIAGRQDIRQIAEIVAKNYRKQRMIRLEAEILSKYGLVSFDDFFSKQQTMHDSVLDTIMKELDDYELGLELIIAGHDKNGEPHIYLIDEPGTSVSYDNVGYCCTGIGESHADSVFAFYGYEPSKTIEEVLYIAYAAKKRAQMASGVGEKTDAWFMDYDGCHKIKQSTIDNLEKYYTPIILDLQGKINVDWESDRESPDE
jgi:hypothetical protein